MAANEVRLVASPLPTRAAFVPTNSGHKLDGEPTSRALNARRLRTWGDAAAPSRHCATTWRLVVQVWPAHDTWWPEQGRARTTATGGSNSPPMGWGVAAKKFCCCTTPSLVWSEQTSDRIHRRRHSDGGAPGGRPWIGLMLSPEAASVRQMCDLRHSLPITTQARWAMFNRMVYQHAQ